MLSLDASLVKGAYQMAKRELSFEEILRILIPVHLAEDSQLHHDWFLGHWRKWQNRLLIVGRRDVIGFCIPWPFHLALSFIQLAAFKIRACCTLLNLTACWDLELVNYLVCKLLSKMLFSLTQSLSLVSQQQALRLWCLVVDYVFKVWNLQVINA